MSTIVHHLWLYPDSHEDSPLFWRIRRFCLRLQGVSDWCRPAGSSPGGHPKPVSLVLMSSTWMEIWWFSLKSPEISWNQMVKNQTNDTALRCLSLKFEASLFLKGEVRKSDHDKPLDGGVWNFNGAVYSSRCTSVLGGNASYWMCIYGHFFTCIGNHCLTIYQVAGFNSSMIRCDVNWDHVEIDKNSPTCHADLPPDIVDDLPIVQDSKTWNVYMWENQWFTPCGKWSPSHPRDADHWRRNSPQAGLAYCDGLDVIWIVLILTSCVFQRCTVMHNKVH